MNMKRHRRCCPACGERFIPWGTWRITRWTSLACPICGVRLNRRFDIQFWLVNLIEALFFISIFAAIHELSLAVGVVLLAVVMLITWMADVLTVRLVVAGKI